jgi:putative peptide zinc metalloprotease protein
VIENLPALREELKLLPAAANSDGSPAWMIVDPVINRFYRIGWLDFELLVRWNTGPAEAIIAAINQQTALHVDEADIESLIVFLQQHNLLQASNSKTANALQQRAQQQKKNTFQWLLQHYLFFRIPLIKPQRLLKNSYPYVAWLYSKAMLVSLVFFAVLGGYLISRQWDTFSATLINQLGFDSLVGFAIALVIAKALHELAHAYTATRYGVRVAHMGVAMVVMFPMLYTDTSESWKLSNSKQRMAIASAGIIAELGLAIIATLAWCLLPNGAVREAMFYLATTSWVLTLLINVSPFLRFDGYFILADILDMPNLHERSAAMAKVWLRRALLGIEDDWPATEQPNWRPWLIIFALFTWVYRFFVYIGIALLVYFFFFKLAGIALFIIELFVFIGRPVLAELTVWWQRRSEMSVIKKKRWLGFFIVLLAVAMIPWHTSISSIGWVHSARQQIIFSPLAGQLQQLPSTDQVTQGDTLFVLRSPDLAHSEMKARTLAEHTWHELNGLMGVSNGEQRRTGLMSRYDHYLAEARLYQQEQQRLVLTASFSGQLFDIDPYLANGVWVKSHQPLAVLADNSAWIVEAYLPENDIARVIVGAKARVKLKEQVPYFIDGVVESVDISPLALLPHPMLDAASGGPINTVVHGKNKRQPQQVLFRVRIRLLEPPVSTRMGLADVTVQGEARAWLPKQFKRVAAVLIRESGF